jgi:hypothetical protein
LKLGICREKPVVQKINSDGHGIQRSYSLREEDHVDLQRQNKSCKFFQLFPNYNPYETIDKNTNKEVHWIRQILVRSLGPTYITYIN